MVPTATANTADNLAYTNALMADDVDAAPATMQADAGIVALEIS